MKKFVLLICLLSGVAGFGQDLNSFLNGPASAIEKADSIYKIARRYHLRFKIDSAIILFEKGIPFALKTDSNTLIATYFIDLSRSYRLKGKPDISLNTIRKARPFLNNSVPDIYRAIYMLRNGQYFSDLRNSDSALHYFDAAEKLYNRTAPYENWVVYEGIANVFTSTLTWEKAEEYFLKAYDITKKVKKRADHGTILFELANFYLTRDNAKRFSEILNEYNAFISDNGKSLTNDPVHSMLFLNWDKYSLAQRIEFLEKVKKSNLDEGYYEGAAASNYQLAITYEEKKDYTKALEYLLENENKYIPPGNLYLVFVNQQHILRVQKEAGMQEPALKTAESLLTLSNKMSDINAKEIALNLEKKYETEKKQKEIALLTSQHELNRIQLKAETEKAEALRRENQLKEEKLAKELLLRQVLQRENILADSSLAREQRLNEALGREGQLKESELKKEKLLTSALSRENDLQEESIQKDRKNKETLWAGIGLLTLAGGIILWQFSRQLKKNKIIKKQAEEMEVLNREIHHRVKNNLQVISSLLDLQSQTLKDDEAADAIKESKQRVQSMAFIHQNLYQGNGANEIEIGNYIHQLAEHLFQTYNIRKDKIRFSTDIEDIKLHTDTVVPLGMILNELISNSLKYAFKDLEEGEIKVEMKRKENDLFLRVKDNGKGLPAGFDVSRLDSFGFKVVRAFVQKLKGKLLIDGKQGTDVQLVISKYKTA